MSGQGRKSFKTITGGRSGVEKKEDKASIVD